MRAEPVGQNHRSVHNDQKWRPQNGWTYCKMIVEVARRCIAGLLRLAIRADPIHLKTLVRVLPVFYKIEASFDQHGAHVRVIAHPIAPTPRIHQWQRDKEKYQERLLRAADPHEWIFELHLTFVLAANALTGSIRLKATTDAPRWGDFSFENFTNSIRLRTEHLCSNRWCRRAPRSTL